jgi:PleD family two-component response regulator
VEKVFVAGNARGGLEPRFQLERLPGVVGPAQGADGFFVKPPNIKELLSKIRLMIAQKLNYEFLKRSYDIAVSQAHTDPLTGLFNLRQLWKVLDREIERSRRYSRSCSLAMIDIDFFKQFNDRYGHLQGDEVLKQAAEIFREHIRVLARHTTALSWPISSTEG